MLSLKKAGSIVCKSVMVFMVMGIVLSGNVGAETYEFVFRIPSSQQWYFSSPRGVGVDPSGNVYVSDSNFHRIQKFDSAGNFITKWGSLGSGDGQFNYPYGLAVDSSGNVYVADTWNQRIQKFDSAGNFITKWGSLGSGDGQFDKPWGIAVDSSGNVYVADTHNNRIQKFDSAGNFITKWGSLGSGDSQFNYPSGVAVDSSGNIYVADLYNQRIQKFDSAGNFITKWGSSGSGDGQFNYHRGVAVDSSGNVYVADTFNQRIQKFDSAGNFITKWGSSGSGDGQFKYPWGVAADSSGNVYVTDSGIQRIQKFDSVGNFITKWGSSGSGDGQLDFPSGIAVDSSGNVYVADTENNRIQKFDSVGNFITKWGSSGSGDGQFNFPYGVAVDSSGNVYVTDSGIHRIQKFGSSGCFITKWGSYGSEVGQFWGPSGVAVDYSGDVYLADKGNNRIQKFSVKVPDLIETAVSNPPASATTGSSFSVTDTVKNQGTESAIASITSYYLSLDTAKGSGDILLTGSRSAPSLGSGGTNTGTITVTIPSSTASGSYYLLACADDTNLVAESNENNNCIASASKVNVSPVTSVTVTPSPGSPQLVGTSITFNATVTGGVSPQYKFYWRDPSGVWRVGQDYSATSSWTWNTTGLVAGNYTIQVWARSAGSIAAYEAFATLSYRLTNPPVRSVALTASPWPPQPVGNSITFNADAVGGVTSQYKFYVRNPAGVWSMGQDYSATSSWTWSTAGLAAGNYTIQVWARSLGSTAAYEAYRSMSYVLSTPVSSVSLTATPTSPRPVGTSIPFNATATGGVTPQYLFYWRDLSNVWHVGQSYSSTSSWTWNTTGLSAGTYLIQVWARSAGSTAAYEAYRSMSYVLN